MPSVAKSPEALVQTGKELITKAVGRKWDVVIESGKGLDVVLADGQKKVDFTAGIGVTNLGHCHPVVNEAAIKQISQITHVQCAIGMSRPYIQLVERLSTIVPHPSLNNFFLWNSGTEAIEAAVKVARKSTNRPNIIVMNGSYHGRTYGASAMTKSKTIYTEGTGPVMPGVFTAAYPFWHTLGVPQTTPEEELVRLASYQLDLLLTQQTAPSDTAAIVIEPVVGEGGYVPAPSAWLRKIRETCDKHGILMIVDEVQSGFGRTGKMFNIEYTPDVRPDLMVFAKGLANGYPLSGIVTRKEIMDSMPAGSLGGTYAGNAVSCAAANGVLDVFASEDILGNVNARSEQLLSGLRAMQESPKTGHLIAEVRGKGLMVAIEFNSPDDSICAMTIKDKSRPVPKDIHSRVQAKAFEKGLMVLTTSIYPVVRFVPALIVTEEQMALALDIIRSSVEEVAMEG